MRMVKCSECGNTVDTNRAIRTKINGKEYRFCNETEKDIFIEKKSGGVYKKDSYAIIYDIVKTSIPIVYKRLKELNNKYSWKEIFEALDKVKSSIEKHYNEKYTTDYALARYIETCINNTYNKETEKAEKATFHILRSKKLAMGISYIIDEDYYEFDDKFKEGWKCYSFKETDRFKQALEGIEKLKEQLKIEGAEQSKNKLYK